MGFCHILMDVINRSDNNLLFLLMKYSTITLNCIDCFLPLGMTRKKHNVCASTVRRKRLVKLTSLKY